jgi:hypothetical protein
VHLAGLILFCVIVGGLVLGLVLRRVGIAWGATVSFFAGLLARLGAAVAFAWIAVQAVERDGAWFDVLAVLMGVLAITGLALTGLLAWAWLRLDSED